MNKQIQSALSELKQAGAIGLPTNSEVENAPDGKTWNGEKNNNEPWSLTKNNSNSLNCMC